MASRPSLADCTSSVLSKEIFSEKGCGKKFTQADRTAQWTDNRNKKKNKNKKQEQQKLNKQNILCEQGGCVVTEQQKMYTDGNSLSRIMNDYFGWMVGWMDGWMAGWMVGWLLGWLVVGCLVGWLNK